MTTIRVLLAEETTKDSEVALLALVVALLALVVALPALVVALLALVVSLQQTRDVGSSLLRTAATRQWR